MSHAQQQSQPTTTSLLSNMNIPPKQHEMRNNSAPTQQQTKTSTRLEKLIKLLESTDLEKSQAAAVEIGNVFANDQTNILNETLKRVHFPFLAQYLIINFVLIKLFPQIALIFANLCEMEHQIGNISSS